MIDQQKAMEYFSQGIDCSQVVLGEFAEEMGLDEETARKVSAAFGGGIWHGEVCGAVAGAMMVIGLKYGHYLEGDETSKNIMVKKINEFKEAFEASHGTIVCKELLGYKIPEQLEEIMEKQLFFQEEKCPQYVCTAIDILKKIL
ncbi:MAG: C-GCAxxG-C-C family protein [Bacillota bacterium]|jgi:C_GCAxxG_C_C family probable redox protein